jgi:RNA polymerase sigma-70 factor (ECF subfamily)
MSTPLNPTAASTLKLLAGKRDEFLAFVERRVGDRALAEDILQDAFAKCVEQLASLRQPAAATAWFYRVLRNQSAESYRRQDRRARTLGAAEAERSLAPQPITLDDVDAGCRCVNRVAAELKPEYAEAITRIELDGLGVKDFAAEQGISANNAAVRVHRARRALARDLAQTCGACAARGCGDCSCES